MVFVQVLRNRIRVHLDVRELGGVSLEVHLQVSLGSEATSADIALEWTLSGVRANVDLEG